MNGSPVRPTGQVQIGLWFTVVHRAADPHVWVHGSPHLLLRHAWFDEHSELTIHSGLQLGGESTKPGWQEHTGLLLISLHMLLGPQGEGVHGSTDFVGGISIKMSWLIFKNVFSCNSIYGFQNIERMDLQSFLEDMYILVCGCR